ISFVGRADDVIVTSGYRVGPFEVESALVEHEAVMEAAVVGKPDAKRGEIIKAVVVLNADYKVCTELQEALQDHVKVRLAAHAFPREVEFVDSLPKTPSGKAWARSEEHTSELQSRFELVCRLLLEKKKTTITAMDSVKPRPT